MVRRGWLKKVTHVFCVWALLAALGALALPYGVSAADASTDNPDLVKCGDDIKIEDRGKEICYINECSVCDLQKLAQNVLNYFLVIAMAVAALLFANAGALYVTSSAKPGNIAKAHSMFTSTLVGLVIVLAAYLFISVIMDSLASFGTYASWNEFLCYQAKNEHCVPKVTKMTLKPSGVQGTPAGPPQPPDNFNCSEWGGYCIEDGSAAADNCKREGHDRWVTSSNSDCKTKDDGASPVCCRPPYSTCPGECVDTEEACTKDKKGTVIPKGDLPEGACATTGAGQVCCQVGAPYGPKDARYCEGDYLSYFNYDQNMTCICVHESAGGDTTIPSGTDKCKDGYSFSWGLWQINLTTANFSVNGRSCQDAFSGKNFDCTVKDMGLYNACVTAVKDPMTNSRLASEKYHSRKPGCKYDDWACTAKYFCNYETCVSTSKCPQNKK